MKFMIALALAAVAASAITDAAPVEGIYVPGDATVLSSSILSLQERFRNRADQTELVTPGQSAEQQFVIPTNFSGVVSSCNIGVDYAQSLYPLVAMGLEDMGGVDFQSPQCGRCVQVDGPAGTVVATVASMCGESCVPGTIQMNEELAKEIGGEGVVGSIPIKWNFVGCPPIEPLRPRPSEQVPTDAPIPTEIPVTDAPTENQNSTAPTNNGTVNFQLRAQTCNGTPIIDHPELTINDTSVQALGALEGHGFQIYKCSSGSWTLFDSTASLFSSYPSCQNRVSVVTHNFLRPGTVSPSFYDQASMSSFTGNVVAKLPVEGTIPSLVAERADGLSTPAGGSLPIMDLIRYVKRLGTSGGVVPANQTCTPELEGEMFSASYQAEYVFYGIRPTQEMLAQYNGNVTA